MRRPRGKITVLLLEPSGIAHLALSYLDRLSGGQKTAGGISAVINLAPGMIITGWVVQRV
jgi:energy-coupling factor transporter ATP-binding protein EcfA2